MTENGRLAVECNPHLVANRLDDERVPLAGFQLAGVGHASADEELGDFHLRGRILLHFADVVPHPAVPFIDQRNANEPDLRPAEVAVEGARVFPVVKLDVNHRGPIEPGFNLDNAILGRHLPVGKPSWAAWAAAELVPF